MASVVSAAASCGPANPTTGSSPAPLVVALDPVSSSYTRVLDGPPATVTMRSGQVSLDPGQSVGKHNTEGYEEVLVVLEGEGDMKITDGPTLRFKGGSVVYCPPHMEHDVVNTGSGKLRYLYVVARAEASTPK